MEHNSTMGEETAEVQLIQQFKFVDWLSVLDLRKYIQMLFILHLPIQMGIRFSTHSLTRRYVVYISSPLKMIQQEGQKQ